MELPQFEKFQNCRKYHPDNYHKNPERSGVLSAEEQIGRFDLNLCTCQKPHEHVDNQEEFNPN